MKEFAITTIDNPYDYFTQFDQWYQYDEDCGYCTCEYLARIACFSDAFSDEENEREAERAIDEIIQFDFAHIYKKVSREASSYEENYD